MQKILYSHRLKAVLQHTVRDLGITISFNDGGSDFSIEENMAVLNETAQLMQIRVRFERSNTGNVVTFAP